MGAHPRVQPAQIEVAELVYLKMKRGAVSVLRTCAYTGQCRKHQSKLNFHAMTTPDMFEWHVCKRGGQQLPGLRARAVQRPRWRRDL